MTRAAQAVWRAEVAMVVRSRWFVGWLVALAIAAEGLLWAGGGGPQAILSLLNLVLVLVPLVTLLYGVTHLHGQRDFIELLLAQPVGRAPLFTGLWAGFAGPVCAGSAIAVLLPVLLHQAWRAAPPAAWALLAAATAVLTMAAAGVGYLIAVRVDDRVRAVACALGAWLLATFVWDGVVLLVAARFAAYPIDGVVIAAMALNPVDLARLMVLAPLDTATLMGYTGAVLRRALGSVGGAALAALALTAWVVVPWRLAARRFARRDF